MEVFNTRDRNLSPPLQKIPKIQKQLTHVITASLRSIPRHPTQTKFSSQRSNCKTEVPSVSNTSP